LTRKTERDGGGDTDPAAPASGQETQGLSSSDPTLLVPAPGSPAVRPSPLPEGTELRIVVPTAAGGEYELRGELGRGGFARVFLARERPARRDVAMKVLAEDQGPVSAEARERFVEEALVTAQLQHPGVVPVYRVGRDDSGRDYYTMRPVEGLTLEAVLARLRLGEARAEAAFPLARLVRAFLSVCQTVSFAHDRGVVHRDLKPANVVIGSYGEVLVIDWGLAKVLGAAEALPPPAASGGLVSIGDDLKGSAWERLERRVESLRHTGGSSLIATMDGALAGTPLYMAPEQLRGRQNEIGRGSDVWALGVMLYEILTLRLPFEARNLSELKDQVLAGAPPSPAQAAPGRRVPPELAEIAMRCLEADPARRYAAAGELASEVEHWIEGGARWRTVADLDFSRLPEGGLPGWTALGGAWRVRDGCLRQEAPGEGHLLWDQPLPGDVRVEVEAMVAPGEDGEISLRLAGSLPEKGVARSRYRGYFLQFGAEGNSRTKLSRNDLDVVVAERRYVPGQWYAVAAELGGGRLTLSIDGAEACSWRDLVPLPGSLVGLYAWSTGLRIRRLRVLSRGASTRVSCLAVPAAFHNRGMLAEAREEYRRVAECHPGREEGLEALFLQGRLAIEIGRGRAQAEREALLAEAGACFDRVERSFMAPLGCLGQAMIRAERGDFEAEAGELARAFRDYRGYEMLRSVGERLWERARALRTEGLGAHGRRLLELALEHHPEGLLSGEGLNLLLSLLDPPAARSALVRALERFAGNEAFAADARVSLGQVLHALGELEPAAEALNAAIAALARRDPEQRLSAAQARQALAEVRRDQGRPDEALRLLDDLIRDYPEQGEMRTRAFARKAAWRLLDGDARGALAACVQAEAYLARGSPYFREYPALIWSAALLMLGEHESAAANIRESASTALRAAGNPDGPAARAWLADDEGRRNNGYFLAAKVLLAAAEDGPEETGRLLREACSDDDRSDLAEVLRMVVGKMTR